jgi:hypothetical protein
MKTVTVPGTLVDLKQKSFFSMSRFRGKRRLVFFPSFVLKISRGHHRRLLAKEAANAAAAANNPFWSELAVRYRRLGPFCLASRRYTNVQANECEEITAIADQKLEQAFTLPRLPASHFLAGNKMIQELTQVEQQSIQQVLGNLTLPATAMHGDFHMFNFARSGEHKFVLLDWEHFEQQGSFVYDHLDFHLSHEMFSQKVDWIDYLAVIDPRPFINTLAARLGARPEALWLFYLLVKVDIRSQRGGGFAHLKVEKKSASLRLLRNQLVSTAVTG